MSADISGRLLWGLEENDVKISVASGKGGTGKTTVAVNLALAVALELQDSNVPPPVPVSQVHLVDCDVEEPNCHIFLNPIYEYDEDQEVPVPEVDDEKCTHCGRCGEVCAFHAILAGPKSVVVFPELCHGCSACWVLCPEGAISESSRAIGKIQRGMALDCFDFTHGVLNTGEALSPPLIKKVKELAENYANEKQKNIKEKGEPVVIMDAPPGSACSMVESVKDADLCLLVTEPTPFGLHDLELAVETLKKLEVPSAVVINRCDIGDERVDKYCKKENIPVISKIPLDRNIAKLYARGKPLVTESHEYKLMFRDMFDKIWIVLRGGDIYA